jgi:hypothetical protein
VSDSIDRSLDEAARTLRDATRTPSDASAMTRARILASHRTGRRRMESASTWLLAAAALLIVLGGSTAWAYWTGRLGSLSRDVHPAIETPAPAPTPAPHPRTPHVAPAPEVVAPEVVSPEIVPPAPIAPSVVVVTEAIEPVVEPAAPEDVTVDPAERRAYREAHALHFEQHDDAAAIAAWDRYLAAYPRGRFALEARYNRALCLVRAGREAEARVALAPFVEGTHGGYRQREATEIVDALDAP